MINAWATQSYWGVRCQIGFGLWAIVCQHLREDQEKNVDGAQWTNWSRSQQDSLGSFTHSFIQWHLSLSPHTSGAVLGIIVYNTYLTHTTAQKHKEGIILPASRMKKGRLRKWLYQTKWQVGEITRFGNWQSWLFFLPNIACFLITFVNLGKWLGPFK